MSGLVENVARAIREEANKHDGPTTFDLLAEAAIRATLASLRTPSSDTLNHAADDWKMSAGGPGSLQTRLLRNHRSVLDAFARDHGLETPDGS